MSACISNLQSQSDCYVKHAIIKDINELCRGAARIPSATCELEWDDMPINKISDSFNHLTLIVAAKLGKIIRNAFACSTKLNPWVTCDSKEANSSFYSLYERISE